MPIPHLPPEIIDYIVDFLHDDQTTLKECCLVSKSCVPRTRRYLFAGIKIRSERDIRLWAKLSQGDENSLARHTRTLSIYCPELVVEADAGEGGWIRAFSNVESLDVNNGAWPDECPLTPFHGVSPSLKSLRVGPIILPSSQLFYLIRSSPLLEDLTVVGDTESSSDEPSVDDNNPHLEAPGVPVISPPFSGSLDFDIYGGMRSTVRQLLDLPNGLRFRKLTFSWDVEEDLRWITDLVMECSDTLEFLYVSHSSRGVFIWHPHPHR